jgi:hypothetical protein
MRCGSCGTENAPDSRFCGGCGAKLTAPENRVAVTHKMPGNARYESGPAPSTPPGTYATPPASYPPPAYSPPPQMPEPVARPADPVVRQRHIVERASTDPVRPTPVPEQLTQRPAPTPPLTQRPAGSQPPTPSVSMPAVPRLRWGLIAIVLVLDLGLAGTGAVLLSEGLRRDEVRLPPVDAAPPPHANAEPRAHAVVAARTAPVSPTDPIKAQVVAALDTAQTHAQRNFDDCYATAGKALPADQTLRGSVGVQFQVLASGHIASVAAVDNDTGSTQLGACLATEIGNWVLPPHPGDPVQITRTITFNPQATP